MMMRKATSTIFYLAIVIGMIVLSLPTTGMGKSGWQQFQNHGLALSYPSEWKRMSPKSTHKIQGMLNQQFLEMGNIMITKERFASVPSPDYLIKERGKFLAEAKMRGGVKSYGEMKPLTINGHSAIEFQDVDKGAQGYSSSVRLLCGKDTWHITFTGNTKAAYQQYYPKIEQIVHSMSLVEQCEDGR
jgi:hypothetical protein